MHWVTQLSRNISVSDAPLPRLSGVIKTFYLHHPLPRASASGLPLAKTTTQGPNPEPFVDRTFRGGTTSADDFQLSVLTNRHPEYLSRKQQFMQKWEKPLVGTGVSVLRIFKVQVRVCACFLFDSICDFHLAIRPKSEKTSALRNTITEEWTSPRTFFIEPNSQLRFSDDTHEGRCYDTS